MKKIIVDKFIKDTLDESFTIPVAFIRMLCTILPNSALSALQEKGFNLDDIITASQQDKPYQVEMHVNEKGIDKKIIIRLA